MPVTIIVGGNYGSEGKGRISAYLAETGKFAAAVRCGGPNSGHTFLMHEEGEKDREVKLRQVPCAIANPSMKYYLPAGSLINGRVLNAEMLMYRLMDSLRIDSNAMIIEEKHRQEEQLLNLNKRIGSTCSGTGAAVADRVMRGDDVKLARDIPGLQPFLTNVSNELMKLHERGERILIEGTQGFGLSLYHTPHYPFATSRDTTAAACLSEVGLSPFTVEEIILVIRMFPIRVAGNSGPLFSEITWDTIREESHYPTPLGELTSVTQHLRRVGRFDLRLVKQAVRVNMPTSIALTGVDYFDYANYGITDFAKLTEPTIDYIEQIEKETRTRVRFIGTGPYYEQLIDRDSFAEG